MSDHVLRNRGFANVDPEFQQFSMNSGRTPGWIRQAHFPDQRSNLGGNFGSTWTTFTLPLPVKTKTFSMPGNDCLWLHDEQSRTPARPNLGEPNPENPVCAVKLNPTPLRSAQNIQLVAQSKNLQLQARTHYEESPNGVKERSKQDFHGAKEIIRTSRYPQSIQFGRIIGMDRLT